jgi:Arc/MetJ-type ribon-helix-helix transcriptional regulator
MATTQVAVRMEAELLEQLDWLVIRCEFDNRADAMRAAIAALAKRERDREIDEQIIAAYTRRPQTDDEVIRPDFSSWNELDDEDWSDWR